MYVINELTGKPMFEPNSCLVVIKHTPQALVFGYVDINQELIDVGFYNVVAHCLEFHRTMKRMVQDHLIFNNRSGYYYSTINLPDEIIRECFIKGQGDFPYNFPKKYEALESFQIFKNKQVIANPHTVPFAEHLHYTFGLEFETSEGYIPEDICFQDGLIPLRDGSISGLEYSTVILNGEQGLNLLEQQLKHLKKYTNFNKECSLHVHMGGFPLDADKLYRLYALCKYLEPDILKYVPRLTFKTAEYKANQKDYCKRLPSFECFEDLYAGLVGTKFFGDFYQAHPNDIARKAKWNVPTRYYWLNLVNALCYTVNKTVEFRFLRPTFSFEKITLWLFILNGILLYAESSNRYTNYLTEVIDKVYPEPVAKYVKDGLNKLSLVTSNQDANGDYIGADILSEQQLFEW